MNVATLDNPKKPKPKSFIKSLRHLYHQLQNPETNPGASSEAWSRLIGLFDFTLSQALRSPESTILSIRSYDLEALKSFLLQKDEQTSASWAEYLSRRSEGGKRELLIDREHARHWLRLAAPVKFVDGTWLSRIHHPFTPPRLRPITRVAWQILSEELGDGDLAKNHVHVYSKLLQSVGIEIGTGDSPKFVSSDENPGNDPRVWAAAIAQLALGMFPDQLLPEIIGFNLAYEAVTLDTLMCAQELKELKLDPTYFSLHITIDNSDSGHTAMALHAVSKYMDTCETPEEIDKMWRRVQAGYVLGDSLPVTPHRLTETEKSVLELFTNKSKPAYAAHLACKGRIGGRKGMRISEWLDPESWVERKYPFLDALASSLFVVPGNPDKSKLVKDTFFGGKMFGAFTNREVAVLEKWILELDHAKLERGVEAAQAAYFGFICQELTAPQPETPNHYSLLGLHDALGESTFLVCSTSVPAQILAKGTTPGELLLASALPLQHYLSSSAKAATENGMVVLRVLRILNSLAEVGDLVAGMDEVLQPFGKGAVDIAWDVMNDTKTPTVLGKEWNWLNSACLAPQANFWFLVGAQFAFALLMVSPEALGVRGDVTCNKLRDMGSKVASELEKLGLHEHKESQYGFWMVINTAITKAL
ncbi:hypothetical protein ABW19_dt0207988 [Dactylella cylindrospora]|nr:hypothetical protein ABW19_dt0207988 [Dactylella cylindrospora]